MDPDQAQENGPQPTEDGQGALEQTMERAMTNLPHLSRTPWLTLPALILTAACATLPGAGPRSLEETVNRVVSTPPLDQVHWGILIVDPATGRTFRYVSPCPA